VAGQVAVLEKDGSLQVLFGRSKILALHHFKKPEQVMGRAEIRRQAQGFLKAAANVGGRFLA